VLAKDKGSNQAVKNLGDRMVRITARLATN